MLWIIHKIGAKLKFQKLSSKNNHFTLNWFPFSPDQFLYVNTSFLMKNSQSPVLILLIPAIFRVEIEATESPGALLLLSLLVGHDCFGTLWENVWMYYIRFCFFSRVCYILFLLLISSHSGAEGPITLALIPRTLPGPENTPYRWKGEVGD